MPVLSPGFATPADASADTCSVAEWFSTRLVAPGVWRVAEPGHVNCWLVEGDERAVLIDTGLGLSDIRAACEPLTDRPIDVFNTHAHFDHVGGDRAFDRVAIHPAGTERLALDTPADLLAEYLSYVPAMVGAYEEIRGVDEEYFELFTSDERIRPLPAGVDAGSWTIPGVLPSATVADGDRIELGGRALEVLHTPGHSPDSICLLLADEGILFTGDTVNSGVLYAHLLESDVEAFAASTRRLAPLADHVRMVCMAHHLRSIAEGPFLAEVAEAFRAITSGDLRAERAEDPFGEPALLARHDRVAVFLPDPDRPHRARVGSWSA